MEFFRGRAVARRLFAVVVGALAVLAFWASPSFAHASLLTVTPTNEALLGSAPSEVVLRFDAPVALDLGAGIKVFGPTGKRVDRAVSRLRDDGKTVVVDVDAASTGTYTVAWRVVSEDAHVLRGSSVFHVRERTGAVDVSSESSVPAWFGWISRCAVLVGSCLLLGAVVFVGRVLRTWDARARVIALAGAGLLLVGSFGRFAGQVAQASGRSLVSAASLWLDAATSTRAGGLDAARVGAAVVACAGVALWGRRVAPSLLLFGSVAAFAASAFGGHAWTARSRSATSMIDLAHQGAAAVWIGGLVCLVAIAGRSVDGEVMQRFGRVAMVSVGVLAASGAWALWAQVGSLHALLSTGYGRLVLAKIAGLVAMAALGWLNRTRLQHAINTVLTVRIETTIAIVVLAVTASLIATVPARESVSEPFETRVERPTMIVDVSVLPAKVGTNTMHLYIYDALGRPYGADVVSATIAAPQVPARRIDILPITRDHFSARSFTLSLRETWTLTLTVVQRGKSDSFSLEVPVR